MAKSKASGIITAIVLILVLALIIGVIGYFSNWFRIKPSTFYIEIDGKPISEDCENVHISRKDTVKVVSLKDSYDVSIYAYSNNVNDFAFTCVYSDGSSSTRSWKELNNVDFTHQFPRKEISNRAFTIDYGIISDLIRSYLGCTSVIIPNMEKLSTVDRFSMVIKSGSASITVFFGIDNIINVKEVIISADEIVW